MSHSSNGGLAMFKKLTSRDNVRLSTTVCAGNNLCNVSHIVDSIKSRSSSWRLLVITLYLPSVSNTTSVIMLSHAMRTTDALSHVVKWGCIVDLLCFYSGNRSHCFFCIEWIVVSRIPANSSLSMERSTLGGK